MKINLFLTKLIFIAVCCMILDLVIGNILQYGYLRIQHGEQGRTNFAVDSCRAQVLILGSSRAAHHYVSPVISAMLAKSCYNAGKDKQRLPYDEAMLRMIYQRYSPALVILDLNPTAFEKTETGLDELSVLLPYYHRHPEIRDILNRRSTFERVKCHSLLYCFNSQPLKIVFNHLSDERDAGEKNGYVPLTIHKEIIPDSPLALPGPEPIDSSLVACFRRILQITRMHHTQLTVVVSPIYYRFSSEPESVRMARSLCEKEGVLFLDYSQSPLFLRHGPASFLDAGHLNDSCASVFSIRLADDLRQKFVKP